MGFALPEDTNFFACTKSKVRTFSKKCLKWLAYKYGYKFVNTASVDCACFEQDAGLPKNMGDPGVLLSINYMGICALIGMVFGPRICTH